MVGRKPSKELMDKMDLAFGMNQAGSNGLLDGLEWHLRLVTL